MDNPKQQIVERIKQANNVLVTVSANPSVDQLSCAIGLSLLLNKLDKHATAVFSGAVPSTIEFLQPEKTIEKTTDSLRDFIIALDKSKADKLRYKVEDEHVKIFITPYRSSISQADLEFSQGDFNVDVVVALGVQDQNDLDQAITAHGRILHDAVVLSVNLQPGMGLGSVNWADERASSLSEMIASIADELAPSALDGQMATAFLTGVVAETARFSNEKTSSSTMTVSARLMAAGANQQLVAEQLQPKPEPPAPEEAPVMPEVAPMDAPVAPTEESVPMDVAPQMPEMTPVEAFQPVVEPAPEPVLAPEPEPAPQPSADGALVIDHHADQQDFSAAPDEGGSEVLGQIHIDEQGQIVTRPEEAPRQSGLILEPPIMGGTLGATADGKNDESAPGFESMSLPPVGGPLLEHNVGSLPSASNSRPIEAPELPQPNLALPSEMPASATADSQTLDDLEHAVESPHIDGDKPELDDLAEAAKRAAQKSEPLPPIAALNAAPVDLDVHEPPKDDGQQMDAATAPLPPQLAPEPAMESSAPPVPPPMFPGVGLPPVPGISPSPVSSGPPSSQSNPFNLPPH